MNYKKEKQFEQEEKIEELLSTLPEYCRDYYVYCSGTLERSTTTILGYLYDIRTFFKYVINNNPSMGNINDITLEILDSMTPKDIQEFMFYQKSHKDEDGNRITNEAVTRSRKLSALRSFYDYLYSFMGLHSNPPALIKSPHITKKKLPHLDKNEINELLDGVETGDSLSKDQKPYQKYSNLRDAAIIKLFLGTGIRVSELVGIDLDDIDWKEKGIKIVRKGGNEDVIYFGEGVGKAIDDYIKFERQPYDDSMRALFVSSRGNKGRLCVRAVEKLVKKYGAGSVKTKKTTPHTLRRSFGVNLYADSSDIYLVSDALNHKDIKVTAEHYTDIDQNRKKSVSKFSDDLLS